MQPRKPKRQSTKPSAAPNLDTGEGFLQVNPSCKLKDGAKVGCVDALPIGGPNSHRPFTTNELLDYEEGAGLQIVFDLVNPIVPLTSVDGRLEVSKSEPEICYRLDAYPSIEVTYDGVGVYQDSEPRGPLAVAGAFPHWPDRAGCFDY